MTILCDLARKYETDKGGSHLRYGGGDSDTCHNYTPVYHNFFEQHRMAFRHVLEIGVHAGSSLRMWKEYFPHAQILGLDTNAECLKQAEDRITIVMADQNNVAALRAAILGWPSFDLILDDGSHERDHQVTSLRTLLPYVRPKGFYVVEDLSPGGDPLAAGRDRLVRELPPTCWYNMVKILGGLGPKVQPHEWLFMASPA